MRASAVLGGKGASAATNWISIDFSSGLVALACGAVGSVALPRLCGTAAHGLEQLCGRGAPNPRAHAQIRGHAADRSIPPAPAARADDPGDARPDGRGVAEPEPLRPRPDGEPAAERPGVP